MEGRLANLAGEVSALQSALEDLRKLHGQLAAEGDALNAQLQSLPQQTNLTNRPSDAQALGSGSTRGSDPGSTFHFSIFTTEPASPIGGHACAERRGRPQHHQQPKSGIHPQSYNAAAAAAAAAMAGTHSTDDPDPLAHAPPGCLAPDLWEEIMMSNFQDEAYPEAEVAASSPYGGAPPLAAGSTTGSPAAGVASAAAAAASVAIPGSATPAAPNSLTPVAASRLSVGIAAAPAAARGGSGGGGLPAGSRDAASLSGVGGVRPSTSSVAGGIAGGEGQLPPAPDGAYAPAAAAAGMAGEAAGPSSIWAAVAEQSAWWQQQQQQQLQQEFVQPPLSEPYPLPPLPQGQLPHPHYPQHQQIHNQASPPQALPPAAAAAAASTMVTPPLPPQQQQQQQQQANELQQQQQPGPHAFAEGGCRRRGSNHLTPAATPQLDVSDSAAGAAAADVGANVAAAGSPFAALARDARDRRDGRSSGGGSSGGGCGPAGSAPVAAPPPPQVPLLGSNPHPLGFSLVSRFPTGGVRSPGPRGKGAGGGGPAAAAAALLQDAGMVPSMSLGGLGGLGGLGAVMGPPASQLLLHRASPSDESAVAPPLEPSAPSQLQQMPSHSSPQPSQQHQPGSSQDLHLQYLQQQQQQQQQTKLESLQGEATAGHYDAGGGGGGSLPVSPRAGAANGLPYGRARPYGARSSGGGAGGGTCEAGGAPAQWHGGEGGVCGAAVVGAVCSAAATGDGAAGFAVGSETAGIRHSLPHGQQQHQQHQQRQHNHPGVSWAVGPNDGCVQSHPGTEGAAAAAAAAAAGTPCPRLDSKPDADATADGEGAAGMAVLTEGEDPRRSRGGDRVSPDAQEPLHCRPLKQQHHQRPHSPMARPRMGSGGAAAAAAAALPGPGPIAPPYGHPWPGPYGSPPQFASPSYGGPYPVPVRYSVSPGRPGMWRRLQARPSSAGGGPPPPGPLMLPLPLPGHGGHSGHSGLTPPPGAPPGAGFGCAPQGGRFPPGQLPPPGMLAAPPAGTLPLHGSAAAGNLSAGAAAAATSSLPH